MTSCYGVHYSLHRREDTGYNPTWCVLTKKTRSLQEPNGAAHEGSSVYRWYAVFILFILRGKFLLHGAVDHDVIIKPINADVPDTHQCVQASLVSILTHWI